MVPFKRGPKNENVVNSCENGGIYRHLHMVMMWYKKAIPELFQACALNKRCGPWPHFQNEGFWILVLLVQALSVYLSQCSLLTIFGKKK